MEDSKYYRIKRWLYVFGFVSLIYSTLYIVRPITTFLKETTPFSLLVNTICIILLFLVAVGIAIKARISKPSSYGIALFVVLAYIYGLVTIEFPEEKIHFIEYGVLAFLVFKALRIDMAGPICYGMAFVLVSIFGWIDEGIQYLLPNRYYQIQDVVLNSVSGALGLLLVFIIQREQS